MLRLLFAALVLSLSAIAEAQPDVKEYVTVIPGDLPIILSAPHGGRTEVPGVPPRRGDGVPDFVTERDTNTLEVTLALAAAIEAALGAKPHVVVARVERKYVDLNRPADAAYESKEVAPIYDAYHAALDAAGKKVQADWGRGLLLDVHGQKDAVDTIYRGTADGKTVTLLTKRFGRAALVGEKSLLGVLEAKGYKILPGCKDDDQKETKKYGGGHIVRTYGSHTAHGIDAIQLEIGKDLREKANHEKLVADVTAAVKTFAKEYLPEKKKTP